MSRKPKHFKKFSHETHHKSKKYIPHLIKGVDDILAERQKYFDFIVGRAEEMARAYGFQKITTPILEEADLFKRRAGLTSDVFKKDLFILEASGSQKVCLRPEGTAAVARAYIEHNLSTWPQPVKLFYNGPMFRHQKIEEGKRRQFYQFGLEVIGSNKSVVDAQLILLVNNLLSGLGLKYTAQINSLGCKECRPIYEKKLAAFLKHKGNDVCRDCRHKIKRHPLNVFTCQDSACQHVLTQAPHIVDFLCEECRSQFVKTLEFLDEARLTYNLNPYLVHGVDYYNKTVFEFWSVVDKIDKSVDNLSDKKGGEKPIHGHPQQPKIEKPIVLGGGGHYDQLMRAIGGPNLPMCGVGLGLDHIIDALKRGEVRLPKEKSWQVFVAQIGDLGRQNALRVFETVRHNGFRVAENLSEDSLRNQLDLASKLGVKYTLILGQQEVLHKTIIIRDMNSGSQETIDQEKIIKELNKRLH